MKCFFNLLLAVFLSAAALTSAKAADNAELQNKLLRAVLQPIPITVFGPVVAPDMQIEDREDDAVKVNFPGARVLGFIPLEDFSLSLRERPDGNWDVFEITLPSLVELPFGDARFGKTEIKGIWSFETQSYLSLDLSIADFAIDASRWSSFSITTSGAHLSVMEQNVLGAGKSAVQLKLFNFFGYIPSNTPETRADDVTLDFQYSAEEAINFNQFLSNFVSYLITDPRLASAKKLEEALPSNKLDQLSFSLTALGLKAGRNGTSDQYLEWYGLEDPFSAQKLKLTYSGRDITPETVGNLTVALSVDGGQSILLGDTANTNGVLKADNLAVTMRADEVTTTKLRDVVPILMKLETLEHAERSELLSSLTAGDFYDALFSFGRFEIEYSGKGLHKPSTFDLEFPSIGGHLDNFSTKFVIGDFNGEKGYVTFDFGVDGFRAIPYEIVTTFNQAQEDGTKIEVTLSDDKVEELETHLRNNMDGAALYGPKQAALSFHLEDFPVDFLRKVLGNISSAGIELTEGGTLVLAAAAALPLLDLNSQSELNFETEKFRISSSGQARIVPMRFISGVSSKAESVLTIENIDALHHAVHAVLQKGVVQGSIDVEAISVLNVFFSILKGYSKVEGNKAILELSSEDGKDYFLLNGRRFYPLNLLSLLPSLASLFALGH